MANKASSEATELDLARDRLDQARQRMLSAALAFCDGSISAGQLRAVRELLRERESKLTEIEDKQQEIFKEDSYPSGPLPDPEVVSADPGTKEAIEEVLVPEEGPEEFKGMITSLDRKLAQLEKDFQQGRVNASQYRAIRRHYLEQRQVALRLHKVHPESERWRTILSEGKTSFLLQQNEAVCHYVSLYDVESQECLFCEGTMPDSADEAMRLLSSFGSAGFKALSGRMLATHAEDGSAWVLIPGKYTAALAVFSQDPPGWQLRALREVHRNFEAANTAILNRGQRKGLVYPNLRRFVRST